MDYTKNPFAPNDTDRHQIWAMLVERDIDAFIAADWSKHGPDFHAESFFGVNAHKSELPDSWRLDFPNLDAYRDEWLRQAAATAKVEYAEPLREALFRATNMRDIDIAGDRAVCHKKFDGVVARADGGQDVLSWQTLYFCGRFNGVWKMTGFVGYMPFPMGKART
ncbi:hypothetical protein [Taklimakanibacter albus]|uniref:Uncharacterized protein n=1 Tax=Taklimakanibacter albus TaxID=2800327 RepID=A0ACC5R814_9HYPH|nr:hypothetical protein [Aestuariivirga sp. YIM B02566]MBK1868783.1 hypothetical protein [Aestuariivirga sp. YIM B02566]